MIGIVLVALMVAGCASQQSPSQAAPSGAAAQPQASGSANMQPQAPSPANASQQVPAKVTAPATTEPKQEPVQTQPPTPPKSNDIVQQIGEALNQKVSTVGTSKMVLEASDLGTGYKIVEKTERTRSDVSDFAKANNWTEGYYVRFARMGENALADNTVVEQYISKYPPGNNQKVLDNEEQRASNENVTNERLSDPKVGERSKAWRMTIKNKYGSDSRAYAIEFIKMDVYGIIYMGGTMTDTDTLKDLAQKAAAKIR